MSDVASPKVVVTHWVHEQVVNELARFSRPVAPARRDVMPRPDVLSALQHADGVLVCMADLVDEEFLAAAPDLRIVSATLKGYDNIDVTACTRRGVWLTILPDHLTAPAAELTLGLTLGILRRIGEGDREVRSGRFAGWRPTLYGATLAGSTVGIIGMGAVGLAFAKLLVACGAEVVFTDVRRGASVVEAEHLGARELPLHDLLAASDVLVPLVPLTDATRALIGRETIGAMHTGAALVNVCRGSVVDEEAVADALEDGRLSGYAADVFAMEDWAEPGRPRGIPERLLRHPATLFTPHLGTAVDEVRLQMSLAAARQAEQALAGERPEYAINQVEE